MDIDKNASAQHRSCRDMTTRGAPLRLAVPYYERLFDLPNVGFATLLEAIWETRDSRVEIIKCHADDLLKRTDYEAVLLVRRVGSTPDHLKWYTQHGIKVAIWADDFHRYLWKNDDHARRLVERFEIASVIFLPYFFQFVQHKVFRPYFSKAVHVPWSVPEWIFEIDNPWGQRRQAVLLSGAVAKQYPLRRWIRSYIRLSRDPLFQHLEHPSYRSLTHGFVGRAFYQELAKYRGAIATTAHTSKPIEYTVAKYVEIPACGTLAFMETTPDLFSLGFVENENFISISRFNFTNKAKVLFSTEGEKIARAGRDLIRRRHTHGIRISLMIDMMLSHFGSGSTV